MSQKLLLLILDGWGYGVQDSKNAIHVANTPFIDKLSKTKLSSKLLTHGAYVGLRVTAASCSKTTFLEDFNLYLFCDLNFSTNCS